VAPDASRPTQTHSIGALEADLTLHDSPEHASSARYTPWAIFACLIWSTAFPAVKTGLQYLPPLTFAGWRFMLAGLLVLPLCGPLHDHLRAVRREWRLVLLIAVLQTVILYGLFFVGLSLVPGAKAAIVSGSSPLICALLAHWLMHNDRMTWGKAASITLGMVGVVIVAVSTKPWASGPDGGRWTELVGLGVLLVGTISSSFAGVIVARYAGPMRPIPLNSAQMLTGGVLLTLISLPVHGLPVAAPPVEFWLIFVYLAAVSATGFSIWFALLKRMKVSVLNMWKFLLPVFGAIGSWVFLAGESPTVATVVGMVCVAAAVLLTQWQAMRGK